MKHLLIIATLFIAVNSFAQVNNVTFKSDGYQVDVIDNEVFLFEKRGTALEEIYSAKITQVKKGSKIEIVDEANNLKLDIKLKDSKKQEIESAKLKVEIETEDLEEEGTKLLKIGEKMEI